MLDCGSASSAIAQPPSAQIKDSTGNQGAGDNCIEFGASGHDHVGDDLRKTPTHPSQSAIPNPQSAIPTPEFPILPPASAVSAARAHALSQFAAVGQIGLSFPFDSCRLLVTLASMEAMRGLRSRVCGHSGTGVGAVRLRHRFISFQMDITPSLSEILGW